MPPAATTLCGRGGRGLDKQEGRRFVQCGGYFLDVLIQDRR
jgi:hypothetical protein